MKERKIIKVYGISVRRVIIFDETLTTFKFKGSAKLFFSDEKRGLKVFFPGQGYKNILDSAFQKILATTKRPLLHVTLNNFTN